MGFPHARNQEGTLSVWVVLVATTPKLQSFHRLEKTAQVYRPLTPTSVHTSTDTSTVATGNLDQKTNDRNPFSRHRGYISKLLRFLVTYQRSTLTPAGERMVCSEASSFVLPQLQPHTTSNPNSRSTILLQVNFLRHLNLRRSANCSQRS